MKFKVSIVVPIYKVEKYLQRCIESICHQTYQNLEIILVDDGSPDHCGEIIEDYAAADHRIISLHKSNGGLSDARNAGMRYVSGDFTLFIDSDDWIESRMVEKMVEASLAFSADIVQCGFYYAYDDHLLFDNQNFSKDGSIEILDNQTLMHELIKNNKIKNFAWGKLYKTEIIKNIPFKTGVVFEDVFWAHHVMHRTNTYVILNTPLYYYLQRADSIVASYSPKSLDMIRGMRERHSFIEKNYQYLSGESLRTILKTCLLHYDRLMTIKSVDQDGKLKNNIHQYIKKNYQMFLKAVETDHMLKNQLRLFVIHPSINVFFLYAEKALRKMNVVPKKTYMERIENAEGSEKFEMDHMH